MSDHKKALVPIESWCYNSPELLHEGIPIDLGLMAEALIYYDQILLNVSNQPQFAAFLSWFIKQDKYPDLLSLFEEETIIVYDYSFATGAVEMNGIHSLLNIQDQIEKEENTFERRYLYHNDIEACFPKKRDRRKLYKVLSGKVIEAKAADFGPAIKNAKRDYHDVKLSCILIQSFIDEIYPLLNIGAPPKIEAKIVDSGNITRTTWNVDFTKLGRLLGRHLNFHLGIPLTAIGHCNRLLWTSNLQNCDLYLGKPMSNLAGNKLYEVGFKVVKSKEIIQSLRAQVEFPDIRSLINAGKLRFDDILLIRKKAKRFRAWLQQEGERDRDAIIAYHNEVAKEVGLARFGRKTLSLFGLISLAAGTFVGEGIGGPLGSTIGAGIGVGTKYLFDLASKIGAGWRPVVFGDWLKDRIANIMKENAD